MKNPIRFWLSLGLSLSIWGTWAWSAENPLEATADESVSEAEILLSDEDLDKLTGPIALYPDMLVALILPAATEAADVVLAARFFSQGGKESEIDEQPWDESVRALARYPEVIQWMDENLAWTQQLGAAFLAQGPDVMKSIQRMRVRAREAGNLTSTQEQTLIVDPDYIRIVPAQAEVIYVPRYNPAIVYVPVSAYYGPVIAYGLPYRSGSWLRYDCNWWSWSIWVGSWNFAYYRTPVWRPPHHSPRPPRVTPPPNTWRPPPGKRPPHRVMPPSHDKRWLARPVPMPGAPDRGLQPIRPRDPGHGIPPKHWERPGTGGRPSDRPSNPNLDSQGPRSRPTFRPEPSPRGATDRVVPENRSSYRPTPKATPPTTTPSIRIQEKPSPSSATTQNWHRERNADPLNRRDRNAITSPSAPAPSVRPSPDKRGLTPPGQTVRPGRAEASVSAGAERRTRNESPTPSLSSPAPSGQRPPHSSHPKRQVSRPVSPPQPTTGNPASNIAPRPEPEKRERGQRK